MLVVRNSRRGRRDQLYQIRQATRSTVTRAPIAVLHYCHPALFPGTFFPYLSTLAVLLSVHETVKWTLRQVWT